MSLNPEPVLACIGDNPGITASQLRNITGCNPGMIGYLQTQGYVDGDASGLNLSARGRAAI